MKRLEARVAQLARAEQRRRLDRMAERLQEMFGSDRVVQSDSEVAISGRGVIRRWLTEPALRFIGRSGQ